MLHIKYMLHLYITGYIDFVYIFIISVYLFDLAYRYSQERTHAYTSVVSYILLT